MRITLTCGDSHVKTTCKGVSQHSYNRFVVHGISKTGQAWYDALPEEHPPIFVRTTTGCERLDYLSSDPIP